MKEDRREDHSQIFLTDALSSPHRERLLFSSSRYQKEVDLRVLQGRTAPNEKMSQNCRLLALRSRRGQASFRDV